MYAFLLTIGTALTILFLFLLFSYTKVDLISQKAMRSLTVFGTLVWVLTIPVSLLFALGLMFSGGPSGTGLYAGGFALLIAGFIMPLVCIYSLSNSWIQLRLGNFKKTIIIIGAPFIPLVIFIMLAREYIFP